MPTYVYRCDSCSSQFEIIQRMSDDPIKTCPDCVGQVRRVIHPVGVVFKGSGWYINDSRPSTSSADTESSKALNDNASKDSTENSAKESKSDTAKPATDSKKSEKPAAKSAAD